MPEKILIADDDPAIRRLLEKVILSNDMLPVLADSGAKALELLSAQDFDLILMDVMLGDMEGFDVIKKLRERGIKTPVIIVSGRNEDYDSLYGLSIGADDYITKPFRPLVLGAKVKALIRRNKGLVTKTDDEDLLICGPFSYNPSTMRFFKNGQELTFSAKEAAMMLLFLKHPRQIFTKEMIYEQIWGTGIAVDDNTIMVYVNRLRGKIEKDRQKPDHIITVRGLGYRFLPDADK